MNLSRADQAKYPRSTRYLKNDLSKVGHMPVIVRAMQTTGQLTQAQFQNALRWGTSPSIQIVAGLPSCASFTPTPGNNVIKIAERIFVDYEAGRGRLVAAAGNVPALGLNVLHEMVHWGDNRDGVDRAGEEGDEFEMLVYRANLGC